MFGWDDETEGQSMEFVCHSKLVGEPLEDF